MAVTFENNCASQKLTVATKMDELALVCLDIPVRNSF